MIMEIMNLATLMKRNPKEVTKLLEDDQELKKQETLASFKEKVENVQEPIHPTEVFQYIMGKQNCRKLENNSNYNAEKLIMH